MIIVTMRDGHGIDDWDVCNLAGSGCEALGTDEAEGRAAIFEDWVEENAEAGRELDEVAGVAEPCRAERCRFCVGREEVGRFDVDGGGSGVGHGDFACD